MIGGGGGRHSVVVIGGRNEGYSVTVKHSAGKTFSPVNNDHA